MRLRQECRCGSSIEIEGEWDRLNRKALEDFDFRHLNCDTPKLETHPLKSLYSVQKSLGSQSPFRVRCLNPGCHFMGLYGHEADLHHDMGEHLKEHGLVVRT